MPRLVKLTATEIMCATIPPSLLLRDNFLYGMHYPGEQKNQSHVNDPVVTDLLVRQRRIFDAPKRREIIADIQRYLAVQQYYVQLPSAVYIAVWEGALKNYGPNLGYDYGGRLMAAWLDR
jgi:ABC-type transport system substrate-binding protein